MDIPTGSHRKLIAAILTAALGAGAPYDVLAPGSAFAAELLPPQMKFAPGNFPRKFAFGAATD